MAERTKYAPGTFSWTDLSTTDQEGAKQFYGELFGWDADDQPVGDGMVYSMMNIGGKPVAGISLQNEMQRQAGAPPAWNSYVTVESADESADRATKLGATVIAPPFDVMDVGRMAVIQDPQGAFFMVWEPKLHIGASIVNAHGALSWNELATTDLDASAEFYSELFGWQAEPLEGMAFPYRVIQNDGASNGGMRAVRGERADVLARVLRHRRHRRFARQGDRARRHHADGPDGHRDGQDRRRAGSPGSRVRAVRRRFRRLTD